MLMNLSNPCLQLIYKHSLHQIDHLCDLNYCWFHYLTAYPAILFVYPILTLYGLLWKGFVLFVLMKSLFLHSHNLLQYYLNLNQWYFSMFISPESAWLSRWLILFINLLALWNEVLSISKIICIPRSLVVLWLFIVHRCRHRRLYRCRYIYWWYYRYGCGCRGLCICGHKNWRYCTRGLGFII